MTRKQMLKVKVQWTRETIGSKPSNSSDLGGGVSDSGGGVIGIAAHPNSQVVLADIGKHVIGDRNKLNARWAPGPWAGMVSYLLAQHNYDEILAISCKLPKHRTKSWTQPWPPYRILCLNRRLTRHQ